MRVYSINLKSSFRTLFKGSEKNSLGTFRSDERQNETGDAFEKSKKTAQGLCSIVAISGFILACFLLTFHKK